MQNRLLVVYMIARILFFEGRLLGYWAEKVGRVLLGLLGCSIWRHFLTFLYGKSSIYITELSFLKKNITELSWLSDFSIYYKIIFFTSLNI